MNQQIPLVGWVCVWVLCRSFSFQWHFVDEWKNSQVERSLPSGDFLITIFFLFGEGGTTHAIDVHTGTKCKFKGVSVTYVYDALIRKWWTQAACVQRMCNTREKWGRLTSFMHVTAILRARKACLLCMSNSHRAWLRESYVLPKS